MVPEAERDSSMIDDGINIGSVNVLTVQILGASMEEECRNHK